MKSMRKLIKRNDDSVQGCFAERNNDNNIMQHIGELYPIKLYFYRVRNSGYVTMATSSRKS